MKKNFLSNTKKSFWRVVLVLILSIGFSITSIKGLARAEVRGMVIDRVCTMQIDKASAETLTKDGYTYYFCSSNCKTAFAKNPEKYAFICPQLHVECNCGHCTGAGVPCKCAEGNLEYHAGEYEHKHEGGEHHIN
jgi:YHS domain-containing protein